jgi:putative oxidoreductase
MNELFLIGRIIFGGFFTYNGLNHFVNLAATAQYATAKGVPFPEVAVVVSGALLVLGGLSVLFGFMPELGLVCLAVFLVAASPLMHNFWDLTDPAQRLNELGHFMKNMALLGASLMMLAVPRPWPYSVEEGRRIAA